ncbi:hypothetical protein D915_011101 [Fasciola hepatica]|uniref:Uncharacterized protein n=1 Tax=Fasciola hepatica TaxID=6192 RepID=A0A4E0QXU1_FASHE|nr:hypothetical protein D915_011101 [Fasciola hepatica]
MRKERKINSILCKPRSSRKLSRHPKKRLNRKHELSQWNPSPADVAEDKPVYTTEKEAVELNPVPRPRGRGGPRAFRGGRGFGPRAEPAEWSQEPQGDLNVE